MKQEEIPERLLECAKTVENVEDRSKVIELLEILIYDTYKFYR